ncbi:MAG: hypothetical protein QW165_03055 [Candidatus Woesearchaeota archaeon]
MTLFFYPTSVHEALREIAPRNAIITPWKKEYDRIIAIKEDHPEAYAQLQKEHPGKRDDQMALALARQAFEKHGFFLKTETLENVIFYAKISPAAAMQPNRAGEVILGLDFLPHETVGNTTYNNLYILGMVPLYHADGTPRLAEVSLANFLELEQKAAVVNAFKRYNPRFFEYFYEPNTITRDLPPWLRKIIEGK